MVELLLLLLVLTKPGVSLTESDFMDALLQASG